MLKRFCVILLIVVLAVSAIIPIGVYADSTDAKLGAFDGAIIFLNGNSGSINANKMVSLLITDKNAKKGTKDRITYVWQFKTDDDSKYSIKLDMLNIDSSEWDNYELALKTSDGNDITYSLQNASFTEIYDFDVYGWFEDGVYTTNVSVENIYGIDGNYKAITAFYGSNNSLLGCDIRDVNVNKADVNLQFKIKAPKNAEKGKVMLWRDLHSLVPISPDSLNANTSPNLFLISDSLCTKYPESDKPQTGWGECIGESLAENINVVNYALGGYTLKDLYELKFPYRHDELSQWDKMMNGYGGNPYLSSGDFVIISSNINDSATYKKTVRSNGELYRFNNANGKDFVKIGSNGWYDYSKIYNIDDLQKASDFEIVYNGGLTIDEYKAYLNNMICEVKSKGATPIVIGSTGFINILPYKSAARDVAISNDITYLDVGCVIDKYYADLKNVKNDIDVYEVFHMKSKGDSLHYCDTGAKLVANTIAMLLKKSKSSLGNYVNDSIIPYIDSDEKYGLGSGTFDKYYGETAEIHFK